MKFKALNLLRWILAIVASIAGFYLATFLAILGLEFVKVILQKFFCQQLDSGQCSNPLWVDAVPFSIFLVLGSMLAAVLVVSLGTFVAPGRQRSTPWIFFLLGTSALLVLGSEILDWPPRMDLVVAMVAAFIAGGVTASLLDRARCGAKNASSS